VSKPGTAEWRRAEASRLIEFGRAAALPDGGFGWLGVNGEIDVTQPRPLMNRPAAVLIGGPPTTGKSTLAAALAPHIDAAILDLDVAAGPLARGPR
jgi:hypothetical protein